MNVLDRILDEPARAVALIQTLLALAVAFGIDLTGEQSAAVLGLAATVAALLEVVRAKVTPTRKLPTPDKPWVSPH